MAAASPTPLGQGSVVTSLGRRTSARQALRRPPSRSQMNGMNGAASGTASKRNSAAGAPHGATDAQQQQQQQYSTLHDSSDDEMPIPMKLSALTKALLSDGASASEAAAAAAAAAAASAPAMATRRRSALNRSALSSSGLDAGADVNSSHQEPQQPQQLQQDRPGVRQTRRHVRAVSVQASGGAPSSASRPTSPPNLLSRDSSPAPRKRVVRLSSTTPATGLGPVVQQQQPPMRRQSSSRQSGTRRATASEEKGHAADAASPSAAMQSSIDAVMASSSSLSSSLPSSSSSSAAQASTRAESAPVDAAINTPSSSVRRVQINVGSSAGRGSASRSTRLSASSSALRAARHADFSMARDGEHIHDSHDSHDIHDEPPSTVGRTTQQQMGSALRSYGAGTASAGTITRSGSRDVDPQQALQSSMRIKRVGKVLGGGFLSGPARRGRRRASDEEGEGNSPDDMISQHHHDGGDIRMSNQESEMGGNAGNSGNSGSARGSQIAHRSGSRSPYYDAYGRDYAATGSPVSGRASSSQHRNSLRSHPSNADLLQQQHNEPEAVPERELPRRRSYRDTEDADRMASKPAAEDFAPPPPSSSARPNLPSAYDQENDLASLARSVKPLVVPGLGDEKDYNNNNNNNNGIRPFRAALQASESRARVPSSSSSAVKPAPAAPVAPVASIAPVAAPISPERKVLSTISRNTPRRPAPPPPPKMSMLETATAATAGAAATAHANKKPRILLKVNGRSYQRVDCVGRGGSGKVYKVTAENGKMFAMKRVSLENADESTIRGFMGEIDLLKKLSGVDRVIQLYDFEMNKEKHMLSLLMELGEMDFNSLLRVRQNPESGKMDPVFVRFYWKEMVECLQAVHQHDIVHSDLKPANFVLVQGRLKLIDFGIANAIQTEMTVNVHRETQIGTPNYMSPESLMDSQQYAFTTGQTGRHPGAGGLLMGAAKGAPRLMKLGKPSDIWSLGCILYQMVYGLPPFGHIQNPMARCQTIITWSHSIDYPARGMGGAPVPPGLIATMKRCLNREQQLRPTCEDLLSPTDPFLYPEAQAMVLGGSGADCMPITEELLGRIIQSVVTRCRERMPSDGEAAAAWPAAYWASVRRAVAAREER